MGFQEKIEHLAKLVQEQQIENLHREGLDCAANIANASTKIVPGKKYWKIDTGGSGKYMVEMSTEKIYGIKGYGVIHKGHYFGTLDEVNDWHWGGYRASRKRIKLEGMMMPVCENSNSFSGSKA